jgi:hypothetical protein
MQRVMHMSQFTYWAPNTVQLQVCTCVPNTLYSCAYWILQYPSSFSFSLPLEGADQGCQILTIFFLALYCVFYGLTYFETKMKVEPKCRQLRVLCLATPNWNLPRECYSHVQWIESCLPGLPGDTLQYLHCTVTQHIQCTHNPAKNTHLNSCIWQSSYHAHVAFPSLMHWGWRTEGRGGRFHNSREENA